MSSFPPTANPEPSASLIQQWQESINQESTVLDEEQKRPVIAEFIHDCLEVYARIIHDVEAQPDPAESTLCRLRSGRHYLVLWADGYDVRNGALDRVMDSSQRLHSLTIRLLLKIGSILTQRLLPNTSSGLQQHASGDKIRVLRGLERLRLLSHSNMETDSGSDTDEEFSDDESPEGDLAQIAQDLTVTVGCLLEIGPRLNNQTLKHFKEPSRPVNVTDWHAYMPFIERIQWRYRQCDDSLATRLGKDNWSRILKRQERILQNEAAQDRSDSPEPLDVDLATPIQPPTTLHDSGIGTSVQSPASKLAETVVTYHGGAGDSMKVPSLTQEALDGRQFKCVGCGRLIQARNMVDWKKHLFEDLRPYICFYDGCNSNSDPFNTKDEWISHILEDHSRHGAELECPICRSNLPGDAMSIVKHLSQHLEEIALMVLPSGQETEESSYDDASEDSPRNVEISGPSPQENGPGYQGDDDDDDEDYRPNLRREHKRTTSITARRSTRRKREPVSTLGQRPVPKVSHITRGAFSCSECREASFKDQASLQRHIKQQHTRPFVCVFHFAQCESTFASKNEWKRHVTSHHLLLNYWLCQLDGCAKLSNTPGSLIKPTGTSRHRNANNIGAQGTCSFGGLPNGAIFNRKDLYTQHLRRIHSIPIVKKQAKAKKSVPEGEDRVRLCQTEAHKLRCALPEYMRCPMPGCDFEAVGHTAWDERMEHVAKHLEKAANGEEAQIMFGGDNDPTLMNWVLRSDVAVVKDDGPGKWALNNPLKPDRSAGGRASAYVTFKHKTETNDDYDDEQDAPGELDN